MAILAQVNAPTNLGFYVKLGSTVDLMESASGYVILAHQENSSRQRTLAEWSRETGEEPPGDLETHLARIRKLGYELRASYLVKGILNISFPIFDDRGSALGALTHSLHRVQPAPCQRRRSNRGPETQRLRDYRGNRRQTPLTAVIPEAPNLCLDEPLFLFLPAPLLPLRKRKSFQRTGQNLATVSWVFGHQIMTSANLTG